MKVAVIGAGLMGNGIAQVSAMAGYEVLLYDISPEALNKAHEMVKKNLNKAIDLGKLNKEEASTALAGIHLVNEIEHVQADLIIEAIVEKLEIKTEVMNKLADVNGPGSIYASNTSSIPLTLIASAFKYPEQVVGIHFFNPAHIMKLVEVIRAEQSADIVVDEAKKFVANIGKTCIVAKDSPGFIVNRVARHFYVEGLKMLEEGVAGHEQIDELIESLGFKMGPFKLMDLIGVETNLSVTTSMYELFNYDQKFMPSRIQQKKAQAGYNGRKSGKGFYDYKT